MKKALITGITGQDGSYLAELLLQKGYQVHGMIRRSSSFNTGRINHIYRDPHEADNRLLLHYGDLNDASSINRMLREVRPDEIYNLAAMSSVAESWRLAVATAEYTAVGVTRLLEGIREACPEARFYQASSSEMFGRAREVPQSERTPFYPRSPYGVAKVYAFWMTVNYREAYGMFAVNGILFNHESPRRGETFVTRKITRAAARIKLGLQDCLYLGNIEAKRDWGFAGDYVHAMWLMLQQDRPDDYVVATGVSHAVRDLVQVAFDHVGLRWQDHVRLDQHFIRPAEVEHLIGDSSKAQAELGWKPTVDFAGLVGMMVDADLERVADRPRRAERSPAL